jgi:hypothetical protein
MPVYSWWKEGFERPFKKICVYSATVNASHSIREGECPIPTPSDASALAFSEAAKKEVLNGTRRSCMIFLNAFNSIKSNFKPCRH